MRILAIDIETRPTLAYVWQAYKADIHVDQIVEPGGVMTFAAKWFEDKSSIEFHADWTDGHENMIQKAWDLLNEADALLHYNGRTFDVPHLQREFMEHGLLPPSPSKQIDLLETVKKQGRFFMNRLAHVAPQLGLKGKIEHEGFPLWTKCIQGDKSAQKRMEEYNKRDVTELEELYTQLRPWIPSHPSYAAHTGEDVCPKCGSSHIQWRGYAITAQTKFRKFQCQACGGWGRSTVKESASHVAQLTSR